MPLSTDSKNLLNEVASVIATGRPVKLDLSSLDDERDNFDEIPAYLAELVETLTVRSRTIRPADRSLFARPVKGQNLYLVVCRYGTPQETVTELSDDMVLVGVGPYGNGFDFPAERKSIGAATADRYFAAEAQKKQEQLMEAKVNAATFITVLRATALYRISQVNPGEAKLRELYELVAKGSKITLEDIALICLKLEISLTDLVRDATTGVHI
jgi:hypothetical protein